LRLIEKEEAAKRLARVILSDIELYNAQKVRSRADLKPELDEGYALFRSRVAPELVPIFSEVVADRLGGPTRPAVKEPAPPVPAVAPPPPPPAAVAPPPPPPAASSHSHLAMPAARRGPMEPREAARRLARVMVASLEGRDGEAGLAGEIAEARALFRSCVLPELAPLFEEALSERGLLGEQPQPVRPAPEPMVKEPAEENLEIAGEATERVMAPPGLEEEPAGGEFPDDDASTMARPSVLESAPFPAPAWGLSRGRLAAVAVAIATASAGIFYLLLTAL